MKEVDMTFSLELMNELCGTRSVSDIDMEATRIIAIGACEIHEDFLMKDSQPAIAYYTARLLNDEIKDPQTNNKKGARL